MKNLDSIFQISVIIPCFNAEYTIEKCLRSILSQTVTVKEIICIDDGSTDLTVSLLKKIEKEVPSDINFIIKTQKNSGPSAARNFGLSIATGNWIAFLDSDDYWVPEKTVTQLKYLYKYNDVKLISSGNHGFKYRFINFKDLLFKNYFQTSSTLVEKQVMINHLFDESQKYSEDYKAWLSIIYSNKSIVTGEILAMSVKNDIFYLGNGLSSKLWLMEKGELSNFRFFYKQGKINKLIYCFIVYYSFIKYLRRLLIVKFRINKC